jgi:RHS repeat-associated protein
LKVRESSVSWTDVRILRQFDYVTATNGTDKRNGKLLTATANNVISGTVFPVVETYTYAGVGGRVSRRQTTVDGRIINLDLTWTELGKPNNIVYPDDTGISDPSRTLSHTYTMGFLSAVPGYASSITYHPNLMVKQVVDFYGVTWAQEIADGQSGRPLDAMARPYSIGISGAATGWSIGPYQYDGAGNIKQITVGASSESYVYDKVLRLTSATIVTGRSTRTQTAQYNAFEFMTNLTTNGSTQSFTEVSGTNHVSGPSYNGAGSMLGWGSYVYTWDPLNQMASIYGGSMTKRTFLYTADGERIEERAGADPINPTSTTLSARGLDGAVLRVLTKSSGTWSWTKDYFYRDGTLLGSRQGPSYSFHLDHLGTVRRVTSNADDPPRIVGTHDYYPFGSEATDPCQDTEELKWTGHERDLQGTCSTQTDDLDYMHARFENPNIGRFLSPDPVRGDPRRPQSFNLFAYVGNNPINRVDPLGLSEATTSPKAGGGQTKSSDGQCANQQDASDPDCEAFKLKQAREEEAARKQKEEEGFARALYQALKKDYARLFAMAKWGLVSHEIAAWGRKNGDGSYKLELWPTDRSKSGQATWHGPIPDWVILQVHTHPLRGPSGQAYQQSPSPVDIGLADKRDLPVFVLTREEVYVVNTEGDVYTLTDGKDLWWRTGGR